MRIFMELEDVDGLYVEIGPSKEMCVRKYLSQNEIDEIRVEDFHGSDNPNPTDEQLWDHLLKYYISKDLLKSLGLELV